MNHRRSLPLTLGFVALLAYFVMPLVWLAISATKTNAGLFSSFGFALSDPFVLLDNVQNVLTREDGVFVRWMQNTFLYSVLGAAGAVMVSVPAAYAFAVFRFRGRRALAIIVIVTIMVPNTALAVPLFKVMRDAGLINTPLAMILPSMVSPFSVYLIWRYFDQAFPHELIDAGRIDGASEPRILRSVVLPALTPIVATVFLLVFVAVWNNFLLPLLVLTDGDLQPLSVGLAGWNERAVHPVNTAPEYTMVITAVLLSAIPLVIAFFLFQRYWRAGLVGGAVR